MLRPGSELLQSVWQRESPEAAIPGELWHHRAAGLGRGPAEASLCGAAPEAQGGAGLARRRPRSCLPQAAARPLAGLRGGCQLPSNFSHKFRVR